MVFPFYFSHEKQQQLNSTVQFKICVKSSWKKTYLYFFYFSDPMRITNYMITATPVPKIQDLDIYKARRHIDRTTRLNCVTIRYTTALGIQIFVKKGFAFVYTRIYKLVEYIRQKLNCYKQTPVTHYKWNISNIRGQYRCRERFNICDINLEICHILFDKIIIKQGTVPVPLKTNLSTLKGVSFREIKFYLNDSSLITCTRRNFISVIAKSPEDFRLVLQLFLIL